MTLVSSSVNWLQPISMITTVPTFESFLMFPEANDQSPSAGTIRCSDATAIEGHLKPKSLNYHRKEKFHRMNIPENARNLVHD